MLNDVKEEFDIPSMEEFYGVDDEMIFDLGHSKRRTAETVRLIPRIFRRFTKYLYEHLPKRWGLPGRMRTPARAREKQVCVARSRRPCGIVAACSRYKSIAGHRVAMSIATIWRRSDVAQKPLRVPGASALNLRIPLGGQ